MLKELEIEQVRKKCQILHHNGDVSSKRLSFGSSPHHHAYKGNVVVKKGVKLLKQ